MNSAAINMGCRYLLGESDFLISFLIDFVEVTRKKKKHFVTKNSENKTLCSKTVAKLGSLQPSYTCLVTTCNKRSYQVLSLFGNKILRQRCLGLGSSPLLWEGWMA